MKRHFSRLTDRAVEAMMDFPNDPVTGLPRGPFTVWDSKVPGLKLRIGRRRATWTFYREFRKRNRRSSIHRTLGDTGHLSQTKG
jgi:hypothetical protein